MFTHETAVKYLADGGSRCPHCGSENLEGGRVQADGPIAWCGVSCLACEREWTDQYTLSGVSDEPARN